MCLRSSHGWCSREKLTEKFQILITSGKTTIFSGQQQSQANNFIKKETLAQVFSCEYSEMLQNIFLKEYVRWLLLVFIIRRKVFYIKRNSYFQRSLQNYVPCVLSCLACFVPYVFVDLTCFWSSCLTFFRCSKFSIFKCISCFVAFRSCCSWCFWCLSYLSFSL